jgi:hypothetical protein
MRTGRFRLGGRGAPRPCRSACYYSNTADAVLLLLCCYCCATLFADLAGPLYYFMVRPFSPLRERRKTFLMTFSLRHQWGPAGKLGIARTTEQHVSVFERMSQLLMQTQSILFIVNPVCSGVQGRRLAGSSN